MKVFLDTNVILDFLSRREPFYTPSDELWAMAETGKLRAYVSVISFNNVYYLLRKSLGEAKARAALSSMLKVVHAVKVDVAVIEQALASQMRDFEDAIQHVCARDAGVDYLITRDPRDFHRTTPRSRRRSRRSSKWNLACATDVGRAHRTNASRR